MILNLKNLHRGGKPAALHLWKDDLHFSGPINPGYLPQHTYQFQHETMGVFDLFIVPIGPQENRMRYEAIFT